MNQRVLYICLCLLLVSSTSLLSAQDVGGMVHSVRVYFPLDSSVVDSTYMQNRATLRLVDSLLRDSAYVSSLKSIEFTTQSSPEGSIAYNGRLAERRQVAMQEYFTAEYPEVDPSKWSFTWIAENWVSFNNHLAKAEELPNRERVLEIAQSDRDPDVKEQMLRTLDGGESWRYITKRILPTQRFGAEVLFSPITYSPIADEPTFVDPSPELEMLPYIAPKQSHSKVILAIKSNLLLDLVSVVNLAVEIPIKERWSVVGEVAYPWWRSWKGDFTMNIESYHAEVKYWLGKRDTQSQLLGWSVGAYGGWGRYDVQPLSKRGVQGELFDVGAQISYSHAIARRLNLEYTIGLGYLSTNYDKYRMANNTQEYGDIKVIPYPWAHNTLKTIIPTRCAVSLVWMIKSKGGDRR